jgi:hypothetical protein
MWAKVGYFLIKDKDILNYFAFSGNAWPSFNEASDPRSTAGAMALRQTRFPVTTVLLNWNVPAGKCLEPMMFGGIVTG